MRLLNTETFDLTPHENGGESLTMSIEYYDNGGGVTMNQAITLQSYANSATFNLGSAALEPDLLRKLADIIEQGNKTAYNAI